MSWEAEQIDSTNRNSDATDASKLIPTFKDRSIATITRIEVTAHIKRIEKRAPEVARNVRSYLWSVFEYAIDSGLAERNPVPSLRVLKKRHQRHHAALSPPRIGAFLRRLDDSTLMEVQTRIAMELVILNVARKSEVIEARWSEVDLERGEWEVPASRMKARRPHWIPLSIQALEHLRALRSITPNGREYLFPNRRDPARPMANRTLNAVMERLGFSGEGTPHGMRSAFSTHFNGKGANPDVVEFCLAHAPPNPVRAAYNRYQYESERRQMLQEWADFLDGLRGLGRG